MKSLRLHEHTFLPSLIGRGGTVIDCGANKGEFAQFLVARTGALVHAIEADPRLAKFLPQHPSIARHHFAVTASGNSAILNLGILNCSSILYQEAGAQERVEVPATTLDAFCKENAIDEIDLLKLDIEGEEVRVLETISEQLLVRTKQITVEFHDFLQPAERPRIESLHRNLISRGFDMISFAYFSYRDTLFLNRRYYEMSALERYSLIARSKYLAGIYRFVRGQALRGWPQSWSQN
jgi:FkbM family methyltransferase